MKKIFGTDGIRGTANVYPMTPELALQVGKAVAKIFKGKNNSNNHRIVIGKDTRLSGYMIENALTAGILSMGVNVFLVGPIPTPGVAHLTRSLDCDCGIMLSASHNPAEDNGIKIFDSKGYKLDDGIEKKIEKLVLTKNIQSSHVQGKEIGKAKRIEDAKGRYIEFCKSSVNSSSLRGLKVVLDCANGAAYQIAPWILTELGAEVRVVNDKPDGLNINRKCGALHPEIIQKQVKLHKADVGLALDGDADRLIVCDEKGNLVDGDQLMAIFANHFNEKNKLAKNTVVATVMSNAGFYEAMEYLGINVVTTKVGDRYVIEELKKNGYNFGGEQSGHLVFHKYATTGDGIITMLQLLKMIKTKKQKLSELSKVMSVYPQVLINVKVNKKTPLNKLKVYKKVKKIEEELGKKGRILVRYSGTENIARVMLEGKNKSKIKKLATEIAKEIRKEIGA